MKSMGMFEISPKKNWQRITNIVFIFLCFISLGFFFALYAEFTKKNPDREMTTTLGSVWVFLLLVWLGLRFRYKQAKKKDANRIK